MEEIKYNSETKEIQFSGHITSFKFYNQFFSALDDHYKENGAKVVPIFSFVKVDEFDSTVLPNIILIGKELKNKHNEKVELKILNTYATKFLESTLFFANVDKRKLISEEIIRGTNREYVEKEIGLDIFNFEIKYLGFYNKLNKQFSYNTVHKIQVFENCSFEYYKNYNDDSIPKENLEVVLDTIRTKKIVYLKPYIKKYYFEILSSYENDKVDTILTILVEIITNSMLYSYSYCVAMLQSKDSKTTISISDTGIGLEGSFKEKPNFEKYVTEKYKSPYKEKLKNYLLIFDALHYSKNKERENLYTLLKLVIDKGGKMRIHYNDVQVVFTSNRCKNCELIPIKCSQCLIDNLSDDKLISPVRFFDTVFPGIHIEVELDF